MDVPTLKISEVLGEGDWGVKQNCFGKADGMLETVDRREFEDSIDPKTSRSKIF